MALTAIYCAIFIAILIIDWRQRIIPNKIIGLVALFTLALLLYDLISPGLLSVAYSFPQSLILSRLLGSLCGLVLAGATFRISSPGNGCRLFYSA